MSAEEQKEIREFVYALAIATIVQPSARDEQVAPGPSDLADLCDVCVARRIAASQGLGSHVDSGGFSLKAWLGTAVHEKLERDLPKVYPHAKREIVVKIGDIPGVGPVEGHIDLFLPLERSAVDYKTTDMEKLKRYKKEAGPGAYGHGLTAQERKELAELKELDLTQRFDPDQHLARLVDLMSRSEEFSGSVPQEHVGQTMLYLYGLRAMGLPADHAALVYIPRDSNKFTDIWVATCAYRPDIAEALIHRASRLAGLARSGRISELEPHPDCWPCVIRPRLSR